MAVERCGQMPLGPRKLNDPLGTSGPASWVLLILSQAGLGEPPLNQVVN